MKMPKIFQGKKSRGQEVSPSSSMEKSPATSPRGVRKPLESRMSYPAAITPSQRPLERQMSFPVTKASVSEIEEDKPRKKAPRLSAEELHEKELAEAFRLIDMNGDGQISVSELGVILKCLGETPTDEDLKLMVQAVDADGDGQIDLQEFINLNKITSNDKGAETRSEELRAAFHVFDIDKNNQISADELHQVLKRLGEQSLTMEECCRMINSVDSDGDGFVNFEEFEKMMSTPVY
ncbi:calcium-binding protein CML [Marchantia polymorpha subsp. ruderalis]|nr:hypothetical protein MARPO_0071s0047 [Marchantia polymorpha]BBN11889.1 hypothetical protein Mp_5g15630 [Marchantia polymorpha subsp. ruderalis]|eukprot:PTQ35431.1 hypothetical protein MARPO_0071s0047 [Marchantia polymorpha]